MVVGGSSRWYLLVIGQLLLQLLRLLPHCGQQVRGGLAMGHCFFHVVVETFPHSGNKEREGETKMILFVLGLLFLCLWMVSE